MPSSNSVLSFYFDMLFDNDIQSVKDSFIGNSTLKDNGYSYLQNQKYYLKEEMLEEDGVMPVFKTDVITKEKFFICLLNFENISIYKTIESEISSLIDLENKKEFLNNIYNDLRILFRRILNTVSDSISLVEDYLSDLLRNLKDKYVNIINSHSVFGNLSKNGGASYFRSLDYLKQSFFIELFDVTCNLGLIDDTDIYPEDFFNAFTISKPQESPDKIKFIVQGGIVAHYFEAIKPFFHNFTNITIELSGVFINPVDKPYSATGIQKSKSVSKEKYLDIKATIDLHINKLKKQYIK